LCEWTSSPILLLALVLFAVRFQLRPSVLVQALAPVQPSSQLLQLGLLASVWNAWSEQAEILIRLYRRQQ